MTEGVVVSKEEMKKRMERMKKGESVEGKGKMEEVKEGASEKKDEIKEKAGEVQEGISEKKGDVSENIEEIKEGASEKKEEIKEKVGEVQEEATKQKEKLEKESKAEGMTPAEKLLNDIVAGFRQRTGEINEAISDYTKESKTTKEPLPTEESKAPKAIEKPLVDVLETNDTITLIVDISGVKKDDIDIGISKNSVEITATYKEEPEVEDAKFTQKERSYGKTHRSIKLSTEIKVKEAKAKYKTCQLTITLPKKVEDITKLNIED